MRIVFCSDPLNPRTVDDAYSAEAGAARRAGFECELVSYEALVNDGDAAAAVRRVAERSSAEPAIYRGWMLRPSDYAALYAALQERGITLINDPDSYRSCHELPASYRFIEPFTPRSVWLSTSGEVSLDEVMELLRPFGAAPLVLKDFVKSRKHEWLEACFIPSAADRGAVERVVRRFLELQGEDLYGGLVFREFVEFEPLTTHSRSGMPLTREYRFFVLDGEPFFWAEYWEEGDYGGDPPPLD